MLGALTPFEEDLLAALDPAALVNHLTRLRELRDLAGAGGGRDRIATYIRSSVRSWRVPLAFHRFNVGLSVPRAVRFTLARRNAPVDAIAHPYSGSTPPDGLTADLRVTALADQHSLTGCIALLDATPTPTTVAQALARGALGQVYISPDDILHPVAVAGLDGALVATPVITIGRAAGEGFLALCAAGPTPVNLQTTVEWRRQQRIVPVATLAGHGQDERDNILLVGATGLIATASLLELCRVLAPHTRRLRRGLRLAWWPQTVAPGAGATWYATHAWEELRAGTAVYLDLQAPGSPPETGDALQATYYASPGLHWFAETTLHDGGATHTTVATPLPATAGAFTGLGLPVLALAHLAARDDQPAVELASTTPTGNSDTGAASSEVAHVAWATSHHLLWLARLGAYPVLPFDLVALARALETRLHDLLASADDAPDLAPLRPRATAFRAAAERLHLTALHLAQTDATHYEEGLTSINHTLRQVNRLLLPLLHHAGDRYAPCVPATSLLPSLTAAQEAHTSATQPEAAYHYHLALLRERNRLLDALNDATAGLEEGLVALRALGIS